VMRRLSAVTGGREKRILANEDGMAGIGEAISSSGNPELVMYFSTFFAKPYQDEKAGDALKKADEHSLGTEYRIVIDSQDSSVECKMMGWAHHERSVTLGLSSSPFWNRLVYPIEMMTLEDDEPTPVESVCVTQVDQLDSPRMLGWAAAQGEFDDVELPEPCALDPTEKHIKVQMHDGRDLMMAFAEKLCRHQYVQGVIDNIAFDSTTNRFVLKCYEDGVVDLRMHWTDKGFGLKVQTVAKGLAQTQLVADVLREKFDRKS